MRLIIDLELLLDFRGIQFCILRHSQDLENSYKASLYGSPFSTISHPEADRYMSTVKPFLNAFKALQYCINQGWETKYKTTIEQQWVTPALQYYCTKGYFGDMSSVIFTSQANQVTDIQALNWPDAMVLDTNPEAVKLMRDARINCRHVSFPAKHDGNEDTVASLEELFTPIDELDEYELWRQYFSLPAKVEFTGTVSHGFGRGSRQLGFPTANLSPIPESVQHLVPGVYAGWATMNGVKYQAAISVGWNPQYDNKEKAVEAYLLNEFDYEFYGELMTLEFVAYLRAESSFKSLQELIQAIKNDVSLTKEILIE